MKFIPKLILKPVRWGLARWNQSKILRLEKQHAALALQCEAARAALQRSPLENKSIGQLRKMAKRHPRLTQACQAELRRRQYIGAQKLQRKAIA